MSLASPQLLTSLFSIQASQVMSHAILQLLVHFLKIRGLGTRYEDYTGDLGSDKNHIRPSPMQAEQACYFLIVCVLCPISIQSQQMKLKSVMAQVLRSENNLPCVSE